MNYLNILPDDVAIIIWKKVYDKSVKSILSWENDYQRKVSNIRPYDLDKEKNKNIFKNLKKGKLTLWLEYMIEYWLKGKVEKYLENETEELVSYKYDDIAPLVLLDEEYLIIEELEFSLDYMKDMINEIGIDNICFLPNPTFSSINIAIKGLGKSPKAIKLI